jgi:DNA (cytosine-5)-methyltransferase 1
MKDPLATTADAPSGSPDEKKIDAHRLPCVRGTRLKLDPRDLGLDDLNRARKWVSELPRPWAVDLFCGAGGLSLGLEEAGLNIVAGADNDQLALETHAAGIGGLSWRGDLGDASAFLEFLKARGVTKADVVAGGPPCQPFSRAGRAKIRSLVASGARPAIDPRVRAWNAYSVIVKALNPRVVLLENVPDLARWNDGLVLAEIQQMLRELGYEPHARILHGEELGVPQHRMRLFIVALRRGQFTWPRRRASVSLKDAIGDLPCIPGGQRQDRIAYKGPKTKFQARARCGVPKKDSDWIYDHVSRDVRDDDREAFKLLRPGGTYASLPKHLQRYRADIFTDKYKRLQWDSVARTITAHIAKDGYWYVHPSQARTLSIREAARLQTFPDWFRFAGHPTNQYRQIGNAVPPALARAVGQRVVAALKTSGTPVSSPVGRLATAWNGSPKSAVNSEERPADLAWRLLLRAVVLGAQRKDVGSRLDPLFEAAPAPKVILNGGWKTVQGALRSLKREDREGSVRELALALKQSSWEIPATESGLAGLPGVSPTAAASIAASAFGRPAVVLDAATRRVASRVSGRPLASDWHARLELLNLAGSVGPSPEFAAAMQRLGREICVPGEPLCDRCPLRRACTSAEQ